VLNSVVLIFSLFLLVLAYQVRRGRLWAWITSFVMLSPTILFGGILLLITVVGGGVPWACASVVVVVASIAALLTLSVPRAVRGYFVRKPAMAPQVPGYPVS
jgi:hypothetical protein